MLQRPTQLLLVRKQPMQIPVEPLAISTQADRLVKRSQERFSWVTRLWLVVSLTFPLFFLIGWFVCKDYLGNDYRFLEASLQAIAATMALVICLRRPIEGMVPLVELIIIFLLGYYAKFYWLVLTLAANDQVALLRFFLPEVQPFLYTENLLRAFELSTWGYLAFCAGAIIAVGGGMFPRARVAIHVSSAKVKKLCMIYVSSAWVMFIATTALTYGLGIGIRGGENIELPFKLAGIITFWRSLLVPGLFLLVLTWSDRKGLKLFWWAALIGLIAFGISTILIEASRGALVGAVAIPLGALWLTYRGFTKRRVFLLVVAFIVVALLRPVFTIYRQLRSSDPSASIAQVAALTFQSAQSISGESSERSLGYLEPFQEVLFRVIGIDSVLFFAPQPDGGMPVDRIAAFLLRREDFADAFTREFIGWQGGVSFGAPSLVGGLYWLSGTAGMVFSIFMLTLFLQWTWMYLYRSRWWTAPFAFVSLVQITFSVGSEGAFGAALQSFLVMAVMFVALEFVSRWKLPRRG